MSTASCLGVVCAKAWQCDSAAPGNTDTHTKKRGDGAMSFPPYSPSKGVDNRLHVYLALLLVSWLFPLWTSLRMGSVKRVVPLGEKQPQLQVVSLMVRESPSVL